MTNDDGQQAASPAPGRQSVAWGRRQSITEEDDFWEKAKKGVGSSAPKTMFVDANAMKERLRETMCKPKYDVADFYHKDGVFQAIARSSLFEKSTLTVIAINALWISVDTDMNKADVLLQADMQFQIAEHFFCTYFLFEWFVRFMAFKRKRSGLKDAWFVFDSFMVFLMVMETWVMTMTLLVLGGPSASGGLGNASILRLLRLLRLSRMARMARLLRCMPELLILVKGMKAAMRSVFFTLLLLFILLYVFGIAFVQLTADSESEEIKRYFGTVMTSMHSLLLDGTMLDDLGSVVQTLSKDSWLLAGIFYFFVLLSALTVMNMLIGVLCEVVSAVAATEREELQVGFVKEKLTQLLVDEGLDEDGDHQISRAEFEKLLEKPGAARLLQEVDVDVLGLVDLADYIFEDEDEDDENKSEDSQPLQLSFEKFMEVVLQLRGTNNATVKDIVDFRKFVKIRLSNFEDRLMRNLESKVNSLGTKLSVVSSKADNDGHDGSSKVKSEDWRPSKVSNSPLRDLADFQEEEEEEEEEEEFPGPPETLASSEAEKAPPVVLRGRAVSTKVLDPSPSITMPTVTAVATPCAAAVAPPVAAAFAPCALPIPSASVGTAATTTQWWQQAARAEWALVAAQRELVALAALHETLLGASQSAAAPGGDAAGGGAVGGDRGEDLRPPLATKFGFPLPVDNSPPWPSFAGPTPQAPAPAAPSLAEQLRTRLVGLGLSSGITAALEALRESREAVCLEDLGMAPPILALASGSHSLVAGATAASTPSTCSGISSCPPAVSSPAVSRPSPLADSLRFGLPCGGGAAAATAVAAPSALQGLSLSPAVRTALVPQFQGRCGDGGGGSGGGGGGSLPPEPAALPRVRLGVVRFAPSSGDSYEGSGANIPGSIDQELDFLT